MSLIASLLSRLLDAVDLGFEAVASVLRVARRGAFASDATSYRGGRFAQLAASDVLIQDVALNANDAGEAKRAIALDPAQVLPLDPESLVFDVAGPLPSEHTSARPERRFVLGVVRKESLAQARAALPFGRRGAIEAFTFLPSALPKAALVFEDPTGRARRRTRRAATAAALAILLYAGNQMLISADAALDRLTANTETQRAFVNRRIRAAERQVRDAEATDATAQTTPHLTLAEAAHRLALLSRALPGDSKIDQVSFEGAALSLTGAAHDGDETELALRRSFEGEQISFNGQQGDAAPAPFEARLAPEARP